MNILALDAACGAAAACLIDADGEISWADGKDGLPHSQSIMPLLERLLAEAEMTWKSLDVLALGVGPGSFTGVRVAAATMAGVNASLQLPVLPLSSLAITAMQSGSNEPMWVIEDARAREAFIGHYQQGGALQDDQCVSWQQVASMTPARFISHTEPVEELRGWQRLESVQPRGEALGQMVRVEMARVDINSLERYVQPAYLQISQAERSAIGG